MKVDSVLAFQDNYIWVIRSGRFCVVVDPGDASPVLTYLDQTQGQLVAILLTHHHPDHVGGVKDLLAAFQDIPVYASLSEKEKVPLANYLVKEGDLVSIAEINSTFQVMDIGGHTLGHIAYYSSSLAMLFCGDTLFAGGCGRIFEGTPQQMWHSLQKLKQLPGDTQVYCGHEYTESNLRFALHLEPNNTQLKARYEWVKKQRIEKQVTVPSLMHDEWSTNPFFRGDSSELQNNLLNFKKDIDFNDPIAIFAATRECKNSF